MRRGGVLVPLFSLRSSASWGIGEFQDLPVFAAWLRHAGQAVVQVLPTTEISEGETSPYSATTAMALDPMYIAVRSMEDFEAAGGESGLSDDDRALLERVRESRRVAYREVRTLKERCLRRAHARFVATDGRGDTERARRYAEFRRSHAVWLDDYALFQALRVTHGHRPWWEWPEPLARRDEAALAEAADALRDEMDFRMYLQWIAGEQWDTARRDCGSVQIFGDVPFMISADSPDVWVRQNEFLLDATIGVPPDAFSETGQDWGLPPWRYEVMAQNDFEWMRLRSARTAALFDGFRIDHLVGLYRTFIRPRDAAQEPYFSPADEEAQRQLGETLVSIYQSCGAEVIAEDLGTVPDFVRESLRRLDVPGYKVLRWERRWSEPGKPYIDPSEYEENSVATTGTHDTEPLVTWWGALTADEQEEVLRLPSVARHVDDTGNPLDAIVRALLDSPSRLVLLPIQDIFQWPDRINMPGTVSGDNWTWTLPLPVDRMLDDPQIRRCGEQLAAWSAAAARRRAA